MKKFKNFMLVLLLMCFSATAWSADFYVAKSNGTDIPTAGTADSPWKTITYAISQVPTGSTLLILYDTYDENVTVPSTKEIYFKGRYGTAYIANGRTLTLNSHITTELFKPEGTTTGITVNSGGKIQDGIDFAVIGCTVNVGAGTYTEDLTIGKAITLTTSATTTLNPVGTTVINITGSGATVSNFAITGGVGILVDGAVTSCTITHNKFVGNTTYGVQNAGTNVVNAEYNWWGYASGPTHSTNPCGSGDKVSDYVDFDPWYSNASMTLTRSILHAPIANVANLPSYFCGVQGKKVSDLNTYITTVNNATIKWYDTNVSTTPLSDTDLLATGDYWASQSLEDCESPRCSVTVVVHSTPAAPTTETDLNFCSGASPTLASIVLVGETGATFTWYSALTGGTVLGTSTALVNGTIYYASQSNICESSTRLAVTVTVTETPGAPEVQSPQTFCEGELPTVSDLVPEMDEPSVVYDINWYDSNVATTPLLGSLPLTTRMYYVTQTLNGCEGPKSEVQVTITPAPAAPTGTATQTFCSGTSPKVANLVAVGDGIKWYDAATAGTAYTGTETLVDGIYYASQNDGCESILRLEVTVTVTTTPLAPTAVAQSFCSGTSPTVENLIPNGTGIIWSTPNGPLPAGSPLYTATFYVSQTLNGCEGPQTPVLVTVNTTPLAPTAVNQSFCSNVSHTVADLSPSIITTGSVSYNWYDVGTGGTALLGSVDLISGNYYFVSATENGCEGPRTGILVTINAAPAAPTAQDMSFCAGAGKTIADLVATPTVTGNEIKWYDNSTGGEPLDEMTPLATDIYYASQTSEFGCESARCSLAVTLTPAPNAPAVESDGPIEFCQDQAKMISDLVSFVTGDDLKWYDAETDGTEYTTPTTTALVTGSYWVSQTSGIGCESPRAEVAVTVNNPAAPDVSNTITAHCFVNQDKLSDLMVSHTGTLTWYDDLGAVIGDTTLLVDGTTYYVSQTVGGCESPTAAVTVTVTTSDPGSPETQDYNLKATNIRKDRATIGWTRGGGLGSFVVASTNPLGDFDMPAGCNDGAYTGFDNNFSVAPSLNGSDYAKIVYIGTGKLFNLTGLTKLTTYYLKVCGFNGTSPNRKYNVDGGTNEKNFRTPLRKEGAEGTDALAGTFSMSLISPNPVTDAVNFTLDVPQDEAYTIEVYDLDGKLVNNFCQGKTYSIGIHNININTSNLSSGTYSLIIKTGADMALTQFVITKQYDYASEVSSA